MRLKIRIPLKYKFLGVLLLITCSGLGTFLTFTRSNFTKDKKNFLREMNLLNSQVMQSELRSLLKVRIEEIGLFCQRLIQKPQDSLNDLSSTNDLLLGFSNRIPDEILSVTFYKITHPLGKLELLKKWDNAVLKKTLGLPEGFRESVEKLLPLPSIAELKPNFEVAVLNRSVSAPVSTPILTLLFPNSSGGSESLKDVIIVVDVLQKFLVAEFEKRSQISEAFLVSANGKLISHPDPAFLAENAGKDFAHPAIDQLKNSASNEKKESEARSVSEAKIKNENYYIALAEAGVGDMYAITQVRESQALRALNELNRTTLLIGALVLTFSVIFSILFAGSLTSNIQKLRLAAEQIGAGNLEVKLDIRSNDEVENVAESFQWMTQRLGELIKESAEKARMEEELETARLVQSTVLATPIIKSEALEIVPHYLAATECGGDFWDAYVHNNKLTILIGDATGHGAPAAIVTAVAKSCLYTLNSVYSKTVLTPEQFLSSLNRIILAACKGRLLMTMCLVQIDLRTGEIQIANAGHESPLLLRATNVQGGKKAKSEVLFSRGERLGFSLDTRYTTLKEQLSPGDALLIYTDGISEAHDASGKEFGERALKKAFAGSGMRELSQMRDDLVISLKEHVKDAPQDDDITFVLLKWKHPIESTTNKTQEIKENRDIAASMQSDRDKKDSDKKAA